MFKNKLTKHIVLYLITVPTIFSHTQFLHAENRKHEKIWDQGLCMQDYSFRKPITIEEVSKIAVTNRQDLESFDYLIESFWHAEHAVLGEFLPQITIIGDTGKSSREEISGISQYPRESITFDMSQLIFSAGGPKIRYKMAQEDTEIAIAQKSTLKNSIRINSETAFLDLKKEILRKELINNLNESSIITFDQNETRKRAGFLNKAQFDNATATYVKDQTTVKNYPTNVDIQTKMLEREVNTFIEPEFISIDQQNLDKINLLTEEQYYKIALANRPDLQEVIHQTKQANLSTKFYKYTYVPEINLTANIQKARMMQCPPKILNEISFDNTPLNWHIGLNATWNFDGFTNLSTSKQFDDLSTSFILKKKDLELNILKDIQSLRNLIETQVDLLEPAEKRLKYATTELDNIKTQYEVGFAALYQYKQAQLACKQADFELTALKIDLRTNYQKLIYLCGYSEEISA